MKLWSIQYTDERYGSKHYYMNIGFETPKEANDELKRLLRDKKKHIKNGVNTELTYRTKFKVVERNLHKIPKS